MHNALDHELLALCDEYFGDQKTGPSRARTAFTEKLLRIHPGHTRASYPPLIFSAPYVAEIARAATAFLELIFSLPDRIFGGDFAALLEFQGLRGAERDDVLQFCTEPLLRRARLCARPDVIPRTSGFAIIEANVTPSLGGLGVCDRYVSTMRDDGLTAYLADRGTRLSAPPMGEIFGKLLKRHCGGAFRRASIPLLLELLPDPGIDAAANFARPDFASIVRAAGLDVVTGFAPFVDVSATGVYYQGRRVDVVFTDFVYAEEKAANVPSGLMAALAGAEANGLVDLLSVPAACCVYDSKANLVLLTSDEFAGRFDESERRLIAAHVPRTFLLTRETANETVRRRRQLVLKAALGLQGRDVHCGPGYSEADWRALIDGALDSGRQYVVQEFLSDLWSYERHIDGVPQCRAALIGPVVLDGTYAGCYLREDARLDKPPVINYARGADWGTVIVAD